MALIQCPECGKEYSEHAKNCPNCGYSSSRKTTKETVEKTGNITRTVIVIFVSVIISGFISYLISEILPAGNIWLNRAVFIGVLFACIGFCKSKGWIGSKNDNE